MLTGGVVRGRRRALHETLPERLRKAYAVRGLQPAVLSRAAELSVNTVASIERGIIPGIDTAEKLARALGLAPCFLAYGVEGAPLPREETLRALGCGVRLRQLREHRGLSQRALGVAAGLSISAVPPVEAGRTVPSVATVEALAVALDVSPCWLAYAEGPSPIEDPDGAAAEISAVKYRPPRSPRKSAAPRSSR